MMKNKAGGAIRFVLAVQIALAGALWSAPASAHGCGSSYECVKAAVIDANRGIVEAINYARDRIIETIKGVGQVQATLQAQATQAAADANTDTQATMERATITRGWQLADECGVTAGSHGVAAAAASAPAKSIGRNSPTSGGGGGGLSSNQVQALQIANGNQPAPPAEVQAALAASGACASFVGNASSPSRLNRCQVATLPTGASNGHPDADIRAETLFDGPQRDPQRMAKRYTVNGDPASQDYRAVQSLMKNLDTPLELRELKRAELTTDAGRRFMALRDAYDARMAVAQKPAQALIANRVEDRSLIDYVKQIATSPVHGAWVHERLAKSAPNWQSRGISFDEMIDMEASRRHLNKQWQLRMAEISVEGHVREQTSMLAFQLYLLQQMNQKLDYIAVATGQTMGTAVRAEMLPQLANAHQAATK